MYLYKKLETEIKAVVLAIGMLISVSVAFLLSLLYPLVGIVICICIIFSVIGYMLYGEYKEYRTKVR